jgi:uncharacterized membrane protein YuzA (DUF378 family)
MVSFILLTIGGLNWLLIGLGGFLGGDWNVVHMVLGSMMWLESLVYVLVGLSAVYLVVTHKQTCKYCGGGMAMGGGMGGM